MICRRLHSVYFRNEIEFCEWIRFISSNCLGYFGMKKFSGYHGNWSNIQRQSFSELVWQNLFYSFKIKYFLSELCIVTQGTGSCCECFMILLERNIKKHTPVHGEAFLVYKLAINYQAMTYSQCVHYALKPNDVIRDNIKVNLVWMEFIVIK